MTCNVAEKAQARLNVDAVLGVLKPDGPFANILKGFEPREEQRSMMRNVLDAYNGNQITLIEAGTGTGKSLAYLIPAMLWAAQTKERTVISTNTITLQEQLLQKDIPLIAKALNLDLKAVLVKGMHNYLCLRKFEEGRHDFYSAQEAEEIQKIDMWKEKTKDGSRSSLPFAPSHAIWEKVAAESDTCNKTKCPHYQECHFFKARREASEAQILIVNHHLLFADLVVRTENENYEDTAILPAYNRIILDEAHNIEDIATEYFALRTSQLDVMRLMARLTAEKGGKVQGKLPLLKEKITGHYRNDFSGNVSSILNRLTNDLPGMRRDLLKQSQETFDAFFDFSQLMQGAARNSEENQNGEGKLRLLPLHHTHMDWKAKLLPLATQFSQTLQRYSQGINALSEDIKQLKNPALDEQVRGMLFEISALANRIEQCSNTITLFTAEKLNDNKVRWIESQALKTMVNTAVVNADLDIARTLAKYLFSKFDTIILCSATLTTNKNFTFIRDRLGLTADYLGKRAIKEYIYDSPFNYIEQALLAIPTDLPNPSDVNFVSVAAERILHALQCSRGNAFVLFTSYTMLKTCFEILENRLKEQRFHLLKQGDDDRQTLLNKFKSTDRSILFGTDSFWEGVDVAGEALRCVIIVKLPFKVPTEPLIQARSEAIAARGGDPFMEYSLPQAIVKFKQGFGRLIRNRRDRGCIVCLDNRVITKRYGGLFLSSLPICQQAFVPSASLQNQMNDFYRRTHFLVNKT